MGVWKEYYHTFQTWIEGPIYSCKGDYGCIYHIQLLDYLRSGGDRQDTWQTVLVQFEAST